MTFCHESFQYIGLIVLLYALISLTIRIVRNVGLFWFGWWKELDFHRYGSWAVVTGGTDGVGRVFVEELAKRGLNVLVISNEREKFDSQMKHIEKTYRVKAKFLYSDFSEAISIYGDIRREIAMLDIAVLVNNVGVCYEKGLPFDEFVTQNEENLDRMININVVAVTKITAAVLPMMVRRKCGGVIINMSSVAAEFPSPLVAVYSASKAYVDFFARALNAEYSSRGLIIQSVRPYFIATRMVSIGSCLIVPTPQQFVKELLRTVGHLNQTNGCLIHSFGSWISHCWFTPNFILEKFMTFSSNWFKRG